MNLYLKMIEPISFIYQSKDQHPATRYLAQECLAVMSQVCVFLNSSLVMEAVHESLMGYQDQTEIYNRFCDRLEAKKFAFISSVTVKNQKILKLEFPLPQAFIFTHEVPESIQDELQRLRAMSTKPIEIIQNIEENKPSVHNSVDLSS